MLGDHGLESTVTPQKSQVSTDPPAGVAPLRRFSRTGQVRGLTLRRERLPGQAGTRILNPSPSGRIPVAQQSRPYNRLTLVYHYRARLGVCKTIPIGKHTSGYPPTTGLDA